MVAICTSTEVFDFMGTGDAERTANATMVTGLIDRVVYGIEQYLGRKLAATSFSIKAHDGRYCSIQGCYAFLRDIYYDIVSITTLKDNGVTLTEGTHFVRTAPNILERIDAVWTDEQLGLEITGVCGLVYNTGTEVSPVWTPLPDLKQIVIETVAIKSGLWSKNIEDGEGNAYQVVRQQLPKTTIAQLEAYKQPVV